jgi:hypothetical protein
MKTAEHTSESEPQAGESVARGGGLRAKHARIIDNPWAVLAAIFCAMMFLGIPLLWVSRGFSLGGKIFWTIATLIYSGVIIWLFWLVMWWSYRSIAGSLGF